MNKDNEIYTKNDGRKYCKCRFCGNEFLVTHGNRRHCPSKNGEENFCKEEHDKQDLRKKQKAILDEIEQKRNDDLKKNRAIKLLDRLLGNRTKIIMTSTELINYGYNNYCDAKMKIEGYMFYIIGDFRVKLLGNNELEISKN